MLLQLPDTFWLVAFFFFEEGEIFLLHFYLALLESSFSNASAGGISMYFFFRSRQGLPYLYNLSWTNVSPVSWSRIEKFIVI